MDQISRRRTSVNLALMLPLLAAGCAEDKKPVQAPATVRAKASPATAPTARRGDPAHPVSGHEPGERVLVLSNIPYAKRATGVLKLDLYLPAEREQKLVLVYFHGGGWVTGFKEDCPGLFWARQGHVVACPQYRWSSVAPFPAQIHDAKVAVKWLRANAGRYGYRPGAVVAMGESSGAHLASLLGTSKGVAALEDPATPKALKALGSGVIGVVDYWGPSDFMAAYEQLRIKLEGRQAESPLVGAMEKLLGVQSDAAMRAASPVTYIDGDEPPFLILHGAEDPTVPPEQSARLAAALRRTGGFVRHKVIAGMEHGPNAIQLEDIHDTTAGFFEDCFNQRICKPPGAGAKPGAKGKPGTGVKHGPQAKPGVEAEPKLETKPEGKKKPQTEKSGDIKDIKPGSRP